MESTNTDLYNKYLKYKTKYNNLKVHVSDMDGGAHKCKNCLTCENCKDCLVCARPKNKKSSRKRASKKSSRKH